MSIVEKLAPDSPLWKDCTTWLQKALLGVNKRPGYARSGYKIATNFNRWPRLHETLQAYVRAQLGSNEPWDPEDSWNLLMSVIKDAKPTMECRDFYAARVLLNLVEAPALDDPIPGNAPEGGETLSLLRAHNADISQKAEFASSVTLRKAHLLGLYGKKAVGSFEVGSGIMREMSATLLAAMLATIEQTKTEREKAHVLEVKEATLEGGWGPHRAVYSYKDGAPFVTINSCNDNPNIGDERAFVALRKVPVPGWEVPNVWHNDVWTKDGEEYFVRVYVRNCCDTDRSGGPATVAHGVRVRIFLMLGPDRAAVFAVIGSDNATKVWDGATLHYDPGVVPEFDQQGAKLENNAHPNGGYMLGPEIFSLGGVQIGYDQMDGQVPSGFPYACYITTKLRIVQGSLVSSEI